MRFTIVIPSYWGRKLGEPFNEEDKVYDHPTPIDSEGTLGRALEGIKLFGDDDFRVVVLGAATHPSLVVRMEERLEEITARFRDDFPLVFIGPSRLEQIWDYMESHGAGDLRHLLSLTGYSNIRNLCLAAACLNGSEAAVLFDDDEVYEDPGYLKKVSESLGDVHAGDFVWGLAGYYLNADGKYYLPRNRDWVYAEWPAVKAMNEAFSSIETGGRLKVTPWVFGGNMVVHRHLYERVAFDPIITRGEDIDYLINARFLGYYFFLDNRLSVRHLPPPKTAPAWRRFREDVDRFVYTREKLRCRDREARGWKQVTAGELDPYPGRFLRDDLEDMVFRTSVLMGLDYLSKGDLRGFEESMANIGRARPDEDGQVSPCARYADFLERWVELIDFLSDSSEIKAYMNGLYA